MQRPTKDETERFWDSVLIPPDLLTACWMWQKAVDKDGYGMFKTQDRRMARAHRFAYECFTGAPAGRLHVLHSCNVPGCVNPAHLRAGTNLDNMADRKAAGHYPEGGGHPNATVSRDTADAIRQDTRTYSEIAKAYGVSESFVWRARRDPAHWSRRLS